MTRVETLEMYGRILREAKRSKIAGAKVAATRRLILADLFFLLAWVCKRSDIAESDWLYSRCREVQAQPDNMLDLWAREHYKSTIITFGLTMQDILAQPEITCGIFSHTRPIARAFLRQIKFEFETNLVLKGCFPDVLWSNPRKEAPKWSEEVGIIVKRKTNPKESTVEAWGLVDGQPTSKHFDLLVYDDPVTRESVTTPDMIQKVTDAWALSLNLGAHGGRRRHIGTRYHYNDTWKHILDRGSATPRIHPATDNGKEDGRPVFLTPERLAEKRRDMGIYIFGCQMLQEPRSDNAMGFRDEWLKFWRPGNYANLNIYMLVDPANAKKKQSDYTSLWVIGIGEDENIMILDIIRDRLNLTERTAAVFAMHRQYRPKEVGYEKYGKDADIEHIETEMARQNYRFRIQELGGSMGKNDRILTLVPQFEQGRIFLPERLVRQNWEGRQEDLVHIFVNDEYKAFPVAIHDDMLDSLARMNDPKFRMVAPNRKIRKGRKAKTQNGVF